MNTTQNLTLCIDGEPVPLWAETPTAALPDLNHPDWQREADDNYECGCFGVYVYNLDGYFLYIDTDQGMPQSATIEAGGIGSHLADWDWSDCAGTLPEWLASWGINAAAEAKLIRAAPSDTGVFAIWREPNYYQGTANAPSASFDRELDEQGHRTDHILLFSSYTEAEAYRSAYHNEPSEYDGIPACNVLSHGQAGADTLTIVKWEG